MADTKITDLTALTGANLASGDQFQGVDVSDTSMAASGTNKKMSARELAAGLPLMGAVGGPPRIAARSSDGSNINSGNTGTTLTDDSALSIPIAASEVWFVEAWLQFFTANATMDAKFGWNVPTSATMRWGFGGAAGAAVVGYGVWATSSSATATLLTAAGSISVGGGNGINNGTMLAGVLINSTNAGNLTLQVAQNTSDAGNLKMLAGSLVRAHRIA